MPRATYPDGEPDIAPAALSLSRTFRVAAPIRSCSRWGLPCRFRCRKRGALLPHLFTLTPRPLRAEKRFVLCGTFPGVAPAGCYPAPYVDGARTFLFRRLSAIAGAAVRPTDTPRHGGSNARRQGIRLVNCDGSLVEADLKKKQAENISSRDVVPAIVRSTGCRRSSR